VGVFFPAVGYLSIHAQKTAKCTNLLHTKYLAQTPKQQ